MKGREGPDVKMSPHFSLREFMPNVDPIPPIPFAILEELDRLVGNILEPLRLGLGFPIIVNSGWRPDAYNRSIGGAAHSDHIYGRAADIRGSATSESWEANTNNIFHWIRENLDGRFGQLIYEDHRESLGNPGKLWVHVSIPSLKHPGTALDPNRLLVTKRRGVYVPWTPALA